MSHSLWVEKYRPTDLSTYVGNEHLKEKVKVYLESEDVPHLLLFGSLGIQALPTHVATSRASDAAFHSCHPRQRRSSQPGWRVRLCRLGCACTPNQLDAASQAQAHTQLTSTRSFVC